MIAVCITTYNHESFIEQCVRSVLAQQCTEPFTIYIGDDASTDRTESVCRRLAKADPRIRYYRREKNMGVVENTLLLYEQILSDGCETIAMLDGDDYWHSANKLQLQIDYLHAHPDCGFVHTASYDEIDGQLRIVPTAQIPTGDISRRYNRQGAITTNCTVMFLSRLLQQDELQAIRAQRFPILDYPLYGLLAQRTRFAYLPELTAVWRNHVSLSQPASLQAVCRYQREYIRMWRWLDSQCPGAFHYNRLHALAWYLWQVFYHTIHRCKVAICKKKKQ